MVETTTNSQEITTLNLAQKTFSKVANRFPGLKALGEKWGLMPKDQPVAQTEQLPVQEAQSGNTAELENNDSPSREVFVSEEKLATLNPDLKIILQALGNKLDTKDLGRIFDNNFDIDPVTAKLVREQKGGFGNIIRDCLQVMIDNNLRPEDINTYSPGMEKPETAKLFHAAIDQFSHSGSWNDFYVRLEVEQRMNVLLALPFSVKNRQEQIDRYRQHSGSSSRNESKLVAYLKEKRNFYPEHLSGKLDTNALATELLIWTASEDPQRQLDYQQLSGLRPPEEGINKVIAEEILSPALDDEQQDALKVYTDMCIAIANKPKDQPIEVIMEKHNIDLRYTETMKKLDEFIESNSGHIEGKPGTAAAQDYLFDVLRSLTICNFLP